MRRVIRPIAIVLVLALVVISCGRDEITLTEYVEVVNDAAAQAGDRAEQLTAEGVLGEDVSPRQVGAGLRRGIDEIRLPLQRSVDDVDPPEQVAELHASLWGWHADLIRIETDLANRMKATPDTHAGWVALSDSAEMAAYRATIAEGRQACLDFQARLDATVDRGVFEGVPWLPSELSEVVKAALGCEWFPEDPDDIYRYPPP